MKKIPYFPSIGYFCPLWSVSSIPSRSYFSNCSRNIFRDLCRFFINAIVEDSSMLALCRDLLHLLNLSRILSQTTHIIPISNWFIDSAMHSASWLASAFWLVSSAIVQRTVRINTYPLCWAFVKSARADQRVSEDILEHLILILSMLHLKLPSEILRQIKSVYFLYNAKEWYSSNASIDRKLSDQVQAMCRTWNMICLKNYILVCFCIPVTCPMLLALSNVCPQKAQCWLHLNLGSSEEFLPSSHLCSVPQFVMNLSTGSCVDKFT